MPLTVSVADAFFHCKNAAYGLDLDLLVALS